jgi:hypothetical protein
MQLAIVTTETPSTLPSLAVFPLEAKTGLDKGTAEVLSDLLLLELRKAGAFSRVVSAKDVEDLVSFERQKELLGCTQQSCMAELAGALGVDLILLGSVARLGRSAVLSVKLLDVKRGRERAAVAQTMCGLSDELLLQALRPSVRELLISAELLAPSLALPAPKEDCSSAASPLRTAAGDPSTPRRLPRTPFLVLGGVSGALGLAVPLIGVIMLGLGAGWAWLLTLPAFTSAFSFVPDKNARIYGLWSLAFTLGGVGIAAVFLGILMLVAGIALATGGWVLGG